MVSLSTTWFYQDGGLRGTAPPNCFVPGKRIINHLQTPFTGSFPVGILQVRLGFNSARKVPLLPCIKCEKDNEYIKHVSIEVPPYHSYMDSSSGQLQPASGARSSVPGRGFWPEGTADQVRAARAPEPTGKSAGTPSYGKRPGSRRKKYRPSRIAPDSSEVSAKSSDPESFAEETKEEPKDVSSDYVIYQTEPEEEPGYELDKKLGRPRSLMDQTTKKPVEGILPYDELWWNWRRHDKGHRPTYKWRKPDSETVFLKIMAENGEVKIQGEHPTEAETVLYKARKHLHKEDRLQAERDRLNRIGPIAYYSEWVKAWKRDTSREAVQKHFEETGEDENTQLLEMLSHQTEREYKIMMGTDTRIRRDPLAMRMQEDQIKQVWGGDPIYPTINYIRDPDEIIDYRGPNFHEPTPNMVDYLKEHGKMISREELQQILASENTEQLEMTDMDEAMAQAVDIGENEDVGDDSVVVKEEEEESEVDEGDDGEVEKGEAEEESEMHDGEEKTTSNWSVLETNPQLHKSKPELEKEGVQEAMEDSENTTDYRTDSETEE